MPDPQAIENINAATRGKRGRRWVFWALIGVLVLSVLGAVVLGAEAWHRQSALSSQSEYFDVATQVRAHFGENVDWPGWYRSRMTGSDGSKAMRDWIERWSGRLSSSTAHGELHAAVHERLSSTGPYEYPEPNPADVHAALATTDALAAEACGLLAYDNLMGMPDLSAGYATFEVIPWLTAVSELHYRAEFKLWLGDRDGAIADAELLYGICLRARPNASLMAHMIGTGVELYALGSVERLLATGTVPQSLIDTVRQCEAAHKVDVVAICESELAVLAQITAQALAEEGSLTPEVGWFEWIDTDDNVEDNLKRFANPADDVRYNASYYQFLLNVARTRTPPLASQVPETLFDIIFGKLDTREAERTLRYQRLYAALEVRRQESTGTVLHQASLSGPRFDLVETNPSGLELLLQWKPGKLRDLAFSRAQSEEAFAESHPPLRLKPAR